MSQDDLFASEEAVVAAAEDHLSEMPTPPSGAGTQAELARMVREYRKLLRITRRMMRLSDRNERELNAPG